MCAAWYTFWLALAVNSLANLITNGIGASAVSGEKDGDPLEWRVGMHREKCRMKCTLDS